MGKRGGTGLNSVSKRKDVRRSVDSSIPLSDRIREALTGSARANDNAPIHIAQAPATPLPSPGEPSSSSAGNLDVPPARSNLSTGRADAPDMLGSSRASLQDAVAAAATDDSRRQARLAFELSKSANSSRPTNLSLWRTWQKLHAAWYGAGEPALPLTIEKIACVGALFKAGRYVSYPNYASRAKAEHLADFPRHGIPWSEELAVAIKDATRSVQRGLGSARQSLPLDLHRVHKLDLDDEPLVDGGPIAPSHFATLGIFFLTREIEIALASSTDVRLDLDRKEVCWSLPVSKNDQRAIGTTRTWGCVCQEDRGIACPFHSAKHILARLDSLAEQLNTEASHLPLFPSIDGQVITKVAAVETIFKLASLIDARTHDDLGRPLYGGHSLRTGGAVALAGLGVDSAKIQCLARWESPMLLRYAKLAPLRTLTDEYRQRALDEDRRNDTNLLATKVADLQKTVDCLLARLSEIDVVSKTAGPRVGLTDEIYIQNKSSGCWHRSSVHNTNALSGQTVCGWVYSVRNSSSVRRLPDNLRGHIFCSKCLPTFAASFNSKVDVSSSESS